ncbi:THAP domain-containing protein 1-like [Leptidea sinapis]|uniref:THAP domain-containing protein 1-like n=1 Tax=Leptidea sinapis TaxID=189913 RepID=UPI002136785D|nr:THAP domain-containing protein 1-like [Leptidea sinapis]
MRVCVCCKIRYQKGNGITFHKFPTGSDQQLWLQNMKMENYCLKPNDLLCSKHFTEDCFVRYASRTSLQQGSSPTIFIEATRNTSSIREDVITRTPCVPEKVGLKKRKLSSIDVHQDIAAIEEATTIKPETTLNIIPLVRIKVEQDDHHENIQCRTISEVCSNIRHDHRYENTSESTKKSMERVKRSLSVSRAREKILSRRVKMLKSRVSSLKTIISNLKKNKMVDDAYVNMLDQYHDFRLQLSQKILNY